MAQPGIVVMGDKKLIRKLERLTKGVTAIVRSATSKSLTPVNKAAKRAAPVDTGLLKKSIGKKIKTYRRSGAVVGLIGVRDGFTEISGGKKRNPAKYGIIIEARTRFLKSSFVSKIPEVVAILSREVGRGIERQAAKGA